MPLYRGMYALGTLEGIVMESNVNDLNVDGTAVASPDMELTLSEIGDHPILRRVAERMASDVRSTSHNAHNSHYSSNT